MDTYIGRDHARDMKKNIAKSSNYRMTAVIDLYARLKKDVALLTHLQYAVPLLDCFFKQPVFTSSLFDKHAGMPSKPMIMNMLARLKKAGIIKVIHEGSGRRPQILALAVLMNIYKGRSVV